MSGKKPATEEESSLYGTVSESRSSIYEDRQRQLMQQSSRGVFFGFGLLRNRRKSLSEEPVQFTAELPTIKKRRNCCTIL